MRIPEVRDALTQLAADLAAGRATQKQGAARIGELVPELYRRPARRRAPVECSPPTPEVAEQIRTIARMNPRLSYRKLADMFDMNIGRISEVIAGKRT
ncbi:hypothetical protein TSA6c_00360 [Azospirillum sp. TSA6c]|nr:hypothetical protein TSA6c_00360 [Azospirillum sp. TSA6c]